MPKKDLRKEQIALLRFEKELTENAKKMAEGRTIAPTALAAGLATLAWAGNSAAEKLGSETPAQVAVQAKNIVNDCGNVTAETLVSLAEVVSKGHELVEKMAVDASFMLLKASGNPKDKPEAVVEMFKSILGLG